MTGKTKNTEFTEARIFAMSPKPANVCEAIIHHASGIAYRGHFETPPPDATWPLLSVSLPVRNVSRWPLVL